MTCGTGKKPVPFCVSSLFRLNRGAVPLLPFMPGKVLTWSDEKLPVLLPIFRFWHALFRISGTLGAFRMRARARSMFRVARAWTKRGAAAWPVPWSRRRCCCPKTPGPILAVLIDGNHGIPDCRLPVGLPPQHPVIKGDSRVLAIAAASVLAKTFRDKLMTALDRRYPGYNFAAHKGYGTKEHRDALLRLGASPMHRHTFAGAHGPRNESDSHETQGRLC